ncbi:hypothetical protein SLEP1_g38609 [Rubroshorea leprosula]|uniref:Uncharacterized protein n=1 Tax=Rubroshorea leprosula TaxID=152421 RepID=A0AAV5KXX3_9ROSI|nr:hypothetical protein SLEP1_g38609 [Rubroshorea leprosula]
MEVYKLEEIFAEKLTVSLRNNHGVTVQFKIKEKEEKESRIKGRIKKKENARRRKETTYSIFPQIPLNLIH